MKAANEVAKAKQDIYVLDIRFDFFPAELKDLRPSENQAILFFIII